MEKEIRFYEAADGKKPFERWFSKLRDINGKGMILKRLRRLKEGNYGKYRNLGKINKLKIHVGPGYRVYFGEYENTIIILLTGGDKSSQKKDIKNANYFWDDFLSWEAK